MSLALVNGKVWTGASFASSVVIEDGRIASTAGVAQTLPSAPGQTGMSVPHEVIDLAGRLVVPGFIDNHLHFVIGSRQLESVQLRDAESPAVFAQRIGAHARKLGAGRWITGGGWDEQRWTPVLAPSRELIDDATPENPVFVTRMDVHSGLANGVALRLAGITRETPDPPGGTIVHDAAGEPTGLLKDAAMRLVSAVIPPPTEEERLSAIRTGLREAARLGVTSFCDMGMSAAAFDDLRAYQRLDAAGELTARVFMYLPIDDWQRVPRIHGDRLRVPGLKGFADGSLGSSTAAFREPYLGEPENRGLLMAEMEDGSMVRFVAGADEANLQLALHAIGDRANDEVLAMFESRPRTRERRFRIEHAQHLDANLVRRFAESQVIASVQPYHAVDDGRWAESKIGAARTAWAFPYRSLLDAGAMVTFGSDWPVAPLDPIAGIAAAVTRRFVPEQRVTVAEALRCYTANNAFAVFAEHKIGTIAPGMRADLVVLSDDLFTIAPEEIENVKVEMTIFDGRVVNS